jgi:ubiquinone biosynthesis protein
MPMLLDPLTRLHENETRLREILTVLGKYGLADWPGISRVSWLRKRMVTTKGEQLDQLGQEERIRLALQELGTTFIKLGQMLSTRPDLVGLPLATELSKLQAGVPADPADVVRRTIKAELGKTPEELFKEFDADAFASASIAQVHRARLHSGDLVAVKVQHDGIETKIHRDLDLLDGLAELAQKHVPALRNYRPVVTVREFRQSLLRELDLRTERRNLEEFARNFADEPSVHFPKAYTELSGRRVLTMEMLEGVLGSDVGKGAPPGVDLTEFARRAGTMYLDMIFRDGFFHADPHPGNYVILPGGVVGVLDCGMVGRLDDGLRQDFEGALHAVTERDAEELTDRIIHLGAPPADLDRDALRGDLAEFVAEYASQSVKELDLTAALGGMCDIVARYRIMLPRTASQLLRTIMLLSGSVTQLDHAFSLMELITDYQARSGKRLLEPGQWLRDARRAARDYDRLARLLPRDLTDILDRMRAGTLEVRHEHQHLQESVHRLVKGFITASVLLSSALLLSQADGTSLGSLKLALGIMSLLAGAFLGFRLLRSISVAESSGQE